MERADREGAAGLGEAAARDWGEQGGLARPSQEQLGTSLKNRVLEHQRPPSPMPGHRLRPHSATSSLPSFSRALQPLRRVPCTPVWGSLREVTTGLGLPLVWAEVTCPGR